MVGQQAGPAFYRLYLHTRLAPAGGSAACPGLPAPHGPQAHALTAALPAPRPNPSNLISRPSSCHPQVGLSKTKDQLSVIEERAKQLSLDLQRTQMDLIAKNSERGLGERRAARGMLASECRVLRTAYLCCNPGG